MSTTVETLEVEALQSSATERGLLIERLIASLDVDPERVMKRRADGRRSDVAG